MITHDDAILDQFTKQAAPFAERHRHDDELLKIIVEMSRVGLSDRVLDVACGPGIVACALATRAREVMGIDFTAAMLHEAEQLRRERGLRNVTWQRGSATNLPFDAESFDCVVSRFAFHHFLAPEAAFREMVRVCRPGGTIMLIDVAPRAEVREAYDDLEKMRDPSHTRALTEPEFERLGAAGGLSLIEKRRCELPSDVAGLLATSFPPPGGAEAFQAAVEADLEAGQDALGIQAFRDGDAIRFNFAVLLVSWAKS